MVPHSLADRQVVYCLLSSAIQVRCMSRYAVRYCYSSFHCWVASPGLHDTSSLHLCLGATKSSLIPASRTVPKIARQIWNPTARQLPRAVNDAHLNSLQVHTLDPTEYLPPLLDSRNCGVQATGYRLEYVVQPGGPNSPDESSFTGLND